MTKFETTITNLILWIISAAVFVIFMGWIGSHFPAVRLVVDLLLLVLLVYSVSKWIWSKLS
jgi:hypothetical protein